MPEPSDDRPEGFTVHKVKDRSTWPYLVHCARFRDIIPASKTLLYLHKRMG
jgi:hypothetical protein